jgi:hypothetical protein
MWLFPRDLLLLQIFSSRSQALEHHLLRTKSGAPAVDRFHIDPLSRRDASAIRQIDNINTHRARGNFIKDKQNLSSFFLTD